MSIYSNSFEGRKPGNPNILFRKKGDIFFKINPKWVQIQKYKSKSRFERSLTMKGFKVIYKGNNTGDISQMRKENLFGSECIFDYYRILE